MSQPSTSPTPLQICQTAREFLADKKHWCQGRYSGPHGSRCLTGALGLAVDEHRLPMNHPAYDVILELAGLEFTLLCEYNDTHTHAEVLALLDRIIEELTPTV